MSGLDDFLPEREPQGIERLYPFLGLEVSKGDVEVIADPKHAQYNRENVAHDSRVYIPEHGLDGLAVLTTNFSEKEQLLLRGSAPSATHPDGRIDLEGMWQIFIGHLRDDSGDLDWQRNAPEGIMNIVRRVKEARRAKELRRESEAFAHARQAAREAEARKRSDYEALEDGVVETARTPRKAAINAAWLAIRYTMTMPRKADTWRMSDPVLDDQVVWMRQKAINPSNARNRVTRGMENDVAVLKESWHVVTQPNSVMLATRLATDLLLAGQVPTQRQDAVITQLVEMGSE